MIPSTVRRVPANTSEHLNQRIRDRTRCGVALLAGASRRELDQRLKELDEEWDVERVLEMNASIAMLTGLGLGFGVDKRWFALSAAVAGFLLQHAVQGWCPPLPILRRMGFRTANEIDQERYAIKALRGDFDDLDRPSVGAEEVDALERFEDEGGPALEEPPTMHRDRIDQLMVAVRA